MPSTIPNSSVGLTVCYIALNSYLMFFEISGPGLANISVLILRHSGMKSLFTPCMLSVCSLYAPMSSPCTRPPTLDMSSDDHDVSNLMCTPSSIHRSCLPIHNYLIYKVCHCLASPPFPTTYHFHTAQFLKIRHAANPYSRPSKSPKKEPPT
ncbi:hypothetical protein BDW42DRAFT_9616 [Aspergillus taichungensis]|uniref:Uncharacterized protein n=1 Tax=Aspergillus taichungensis TaxID=482145 RepID=A0A2J5HJ03_9EURO|nr:hypothetical protein BDW42DRAFT_9616 [Aspergillus taichungensis]